MIDLAQSTTLCRLVGDPTRVRLLALLKIEELTVAELTRALELPQSRVSTHLGRLREAGLVRARRVGASSYYRLHPTAGEAKALWAWVDASTSDPLLEQDARRAAAVVRARSETGTWAEQVAGHMARHYSPGRTWQALTRGLLGLLDLGDVLDVASGDGAVAELLAPHARGVTCLDISPRVVAAGQARLGHVRDLRFVRGDMHALPFDARSFDQALLMSALGVTTAPERVLAELARVLRPGGALVGNTLAPHPHHEAVAAYDHVSFGHAPEELRALLDGAGFDVRVCELTSREKRAPHFEIVTFVARRRTEEALS